MARSLPWEGDVVRRARIFDLRGNADNAERGPRRNLVCWGEDHSGVGRCVAVSVGYRDQNNLAVLK